VATENDKGDAVPAVGKPAEAGPATPTGGKPAADKSGKPRWLLPTAVLLVIALVGALVATVWFGVKLAQGFAVEQARSNAVSAAKDVATNFTTYDVGNIDKDTQRLLAGTTPSYSASFDADKGGFLTRVKSGQVRSTGEVTEAGLSSYDPAANLARVLVTVRAQISSKDSPAAESRDYRLEITMVDTGDWLAQNVEFIS
jgi:Mce-associated membrane protein